MSKPDGTTSAPGSLGSASGPIAVALTAVKPTDRPVGPAPRAAAAAPASAVGPKRAVHEPAERNPRLDADLQAVIGQQLRAVYHEILNEPVPDRFVQLLEQLATKAADQP
jgi:hypothetical protein